MSLLSMSEVARLGALRVPVRGPEGPPRSAELTRVRDHALELLQAASGVDGLVLSEADLKLAPPLAGGALWLASWSPARLVTELDGGPKDGALVAMQPLRARLEYRQMAPGWARAAAAGFPLPKVSYVYHLAGYDAAGAKFSHRYQE